MAPSRRHRQAAKKIAEIPVRAKTAESALAGGAVSRTEKLIWAGVLLAAYAVLATWGQFDFGDLMGYYNLQADAFLAGHLYIQPTPEQVQLTDMVPFEGRYYLQWGPFPALLHALPRLAGAKLTDRVACILAGWLASLVFLEIILLLRHRYFPAVPKWACPWFFFAFGLGTPTCLVTLQGSIYHENIIIAALCVLLSFLALLRYAESPAARWAWLAGLAIAAAITTRVTMALYAMGLFAGILALDFQRKRPLKGALIALAAFSAPALGAGVLMLAYNQVRFRSSLEYGQTYLPSTQGVTAPYALARVPKNFRHYVLAPIRLSRDIPWLTHAGWWPLAQTDHPEDMSSMFLASPFLLLGALNWPLVLNRQQPAAAKVFAAAVAASGLIMFFSMLCFVGTARRYMEDFVPMFMILAFMGAAASARPGEDWGRWQAPAWIILLASALLHIHLTFFQLVTAGVTDRNAMNLFVTVSPAIRRIAPGPKLDEQEATTRNDLGVLCLRERKYADAVRHFALAEQLMPHSPVIRKNLAMARQLGLRQ